MNDVRPEDEDRTEELGPPAEDATPDEDVDAEPDEEPEADEDQE